jgi:fucose permease
LSKINGADAQPTYIPYVLVGYVSLFALAFLDNSRGPFFQDIIADLQLKDSVASLFFAATSFMAFCLGRLSPKILSRYMRLLDLVRLGHLVMVIGFALISQARSLPGLLAAATVFGIGYGIINFTQNILIVEGANPVLRRRLLSGLHSIYALSSLVAPLLISFLIENSFAWRQVFLAFSVLPMGAFAATFIARPQKPQAIETKNPALIQSFALKSFLVSAGIAFYVVAELLLSTRIPLYFRRIENTPAETAARFLALFFLLLFVGRFGFAFFKLDKYSNRAIMLACLFISICTVGLGLFVAPVWLAMTGLPMAPFFAVSLNYITESFGRGAHAALGSALALQSLFVVVMHYLMGWVTEVWGIRTAMLVTPLFLLLSALLIYLGSRTANARTA